MMKDFGPNGVCCDATHGTTGYEFKLSSLLVVDEFAEGVPVAYCLSNKETNSVLRPFFEKVMEKTGPISPAWFMSDLAPQFYDSFTDVNSCSPKRLFCTWHVDKAWQKMLNEKVITENKGGGRGRGFKVKQWRVQKIGRIGRLF